MSKDFRTRTRLQAQPAEISFNLLRKSHFMIRSDIKVDEMFANFLSLNTGIRINKNGHLKPPFSSPLLCSKGS